ncbi:PWWP domain-containing protein 2A-like [Chrysoperla carnea]|uniref:PWWP domain-containing protein 2A-like n=1 Tax=Chrysoperla carnea TaxID=189513 RepID=UPI001D066520|nr:PWWP domain-containing protein 2A-like [Chrysoperla carnea]
MAFHDTITDIHLEKNSKILVNVEEALPDIIVVTYTYDSKLFQGVLLDSTKRNLPFGVHKIHPAFTPAEPKTGDNDDKLYSVSQRFNYQEKPNQTTLPKRPTKAQSRVRNQRMTVRLRPRQVLCSKCRGICNENSENVDHSRSNSKRSSRNNTDNNNTNTSSNVPHHEFNTRLQAKEKKLSEQSAPPRSVFSDNQINANNKRQHADQAMCPTLIPKIPRLQPNDITSAINGNKIKIIGNYVVKPSQPSPSPSCENDDPLSMAKDPLAFNNNDVIETQQISDNSSDQYYETSDQGDMHDSSSSAKQKRSMVLRKKKSVGSMEDLWDETVFEEAGNNGGVATLDGGTRTLKISFGREGEGTVLKIPKIDTFESANHQSEDNVTSSNRDATAKAAKRALKKAKKEARRKILIGAGQSPVYTLSGASPRYTLASPRYTIGSTSPRYTISTTEALIPRRHKHKVKHKKKHRDERKHKTVQEDPLFIPDTDTAIKERCLKQKLSISLKRLTENSYSSKCSNKTTSPAGSSDGFEDSPPNFPPVPQPLMMHISTEPATIGIDADGNRLEVGDVVWGKIHGFPWWPGKVLSITASECTASSNTDYDEHTMRPQAHVAWYGSSTSSLMPCDQLSPFLENFKSRYNKKKRGPYKEAIRQATNEARSEQQHATSTTNSVTTALVPLVSPPLASPREIDVAS